jgi:PhoH-like ATPase
MKRKSFREWPDRALRRSDVAAQTRRDSTTDRTARKGSKTHPAAATSTGSAGKDKPAGANGIAKHSSGAAGGAKPTASSRARAAEGPSSVSLRKHFVLDTNVLLHNPNAIFKFEEHEVVIPMTVIEELDTFKKNNDERGRNARAVIRALDKLRAEGPLFEGVRWNDAGGSIRIDRGDLALPHGLDSDKPDNRILAVAHTMHASGKRTIFITKDINARVKGDALGIPAEDFEHDHVDTDWLYTGYVSMTVPGTIIDDLYNERQLSVDALSGISVKLSNGTERSGLDPIPNQFVVLQNADDDSHTGLARVLADTGHLIPVTGPRKPVYGVMARNLQQTMALDLLLDEEVKIISLIGPAGTGKTLMALAAGLQKTLKEERYDKLLTARPIMPLGRDIGFLPGDKDEKLSMWMQPVFDNLAYLLSTRGTHSRDDADSKSAEQRMDQLMASGKVVLEPLTYIRGRSLPHQFFVVDEAQNLSPHEVKTIVSRVGDGTKIILCGDILQIDNPYLDSASNGLSHLIERMKGQRIAGHVTLVKTERSDLASLAAEVL